MNLFLASMSFDNILVLLVLVIVSGISSWLQKKRKPEETEKSRDESVSPPLSPREAAPDQPDMEEILRRLLGGEPSSPAPPSPASPPPLAETRHDDPRPLVVSGEHRSPPENRWREEAEPPYATIPPRVERPVAPSPSRVRPPVPPIVLQTNERSTPTAPRPEKLNAPPRRASKVVVGVRRRRHSLEGDRVIAQLRNPRTVRSAFVASLVFGPPKSLESPQP